MTTPLLTTKLYFPSERPNLVPRPRLVARLQDGLQGLPLPTITPNIGTVGLTIVFVAVALWRFARQEF